MDDLPDRLARRRRELQRREIRRRQVRRRRLTLLAGVLAVAGIPLFLLARGGGTIEVQGQTAVAKAGGVQPGSSWKPSKAPVPTQSTQVWPSAVNLSP